jgi:hypothetical protein
MGEKFFPFDSVNADRVYRAEDFASFFGDVITSGVSVATENPLAVTSAGGLAVSLGVGKAWIKGHLYENTATMSFSVAAGAAQPRIDRLVLRMDTAERKIGAVLVRGTPAATPAAPALLRNADYYDLGLAEITVPASAISISTSNIRDTRPDDNICGVVRCLVEKLDITAFMKNCQKDFDDWFNMLKEVLDENTATKLQQQITSLREDLDNGEYSTPAILNLKTVPGAAVTLKQGDITLTGTADAKGSLTMNPSKLGNWTITIKTANATYTDTLAVEVIGIFRKVFPGLSTMKPADINAVGQAGAARELFNIGDTVNVTLTDGEAITLRLEDFDHDDLVAGGKAKMSFMMVDCLNTTAKMNATNTNVGGWNSSAMRSSMVAYLNKFPAEWRAIIKPVKKKTTSGNKSTTIQTTNDSLWLASFKEVGLYTTTVGYSEEGETYPLFTDNASRIKKVKGSRSHWWSRSPYTSGATHFHLVYSSGSDSNNNASYTCGVCLGLCV